MLELPCEAGEHYIVKDKTYGFSCQKCDLKGDCEDIKVAPCRGLELVMEAELQTHIDAELQLREAQEQVSRDEALARQLLEEDQQKLLQEELALELAEAEMAEALLQLQLEQEEEGLLALQAEHRSLASIACNPMPPPAVPHHVSVRPASTSPLDECQLVWVESLRPGCYRHLARGGYGTRHRAPCCQGQRTRRVSG